MTKFIHLLALLILTELTVLAQSDAIISSTADRSIEPAFRMRIRPTIIDTIVGVTTINYPLLVVREETSIQIAPIEAANIRQRQQLNKLYNGYAKLGGGSRLMGLGEVYYNSLRSRKYNWGIHAQHLSEWGKISNFAPSMYDRSSIKTFGHVQERRYSYGGNLSYMNQGLHYYGFRNPNASRDSISQRFNSIDFSGYYASHPKDSSALNYRIGLDYSYFQDKKPAEDTLNKWRARENFFALRTNWSYKSSNNILLSNMEADLDILHNDYRYGIKDSALSAIDTGFVNSNTVIQLRPMTHFYGKDEKLQFKFGGEVAVDIRERVRASAYPILQVRYSLFDDLFIPYAGVTGGLKQQRFQTLTRTNEFINSAVDLDNMQRYALKAGITGTLSKRMTFNIGAEFSHNRNMAFFLNDTLQSSGNQFTVIYDTVNISTFTGSLTYQHNERLKIDGIGRFNSYQMRNNPYAWNLPQIEFILRGKYNVANKLYVNLDLTLEGIRRARVFDPTIENVFEQDQMLVVPLGFIADANLSAEYRYTQRLSFFVNFNNFAAQRYQRWYNYPVQAFQFMMGATFRF